MDRITKQWIERAEYDLETARSLLHSKRYLYVSFMCQQCMVKNKAQIKKIVRAYTEEVSKDYKISQVILFGSYAKGEARDESDIDLAIVSPDFRNKPEMEILENLSRKAMNVNTSLEVLAFTPEELKSPDSRTLPYQIKKYGIRMAA